MITVQIDSLISQASLSALQEAVKPDTLLTLLSLRLLKYVDESFKTHGRGRWKPLAWNTVALRQRGGSEPLQDTGRYKQSFTVPETDHQTFIEVGTNLKTSTGVPLGKIHEEGTGPYIIKVRRAKVLAAQLGQGAGGAGAVFMNSTHRATSWMFFGKTVHHPGIPARPVLPTTVAEAEAVLKPTVDGALERAVERGLINGSD